MVSRFLSDIKKKDFEFNYDAGERCVKFIELLCRHWKGEWAGKPIILEPHQHFYFINLFGWLRADGTRRFRSGYKEVARKNAKTTEQALIGLFHMSKDFEEGAQVYAAATKEAQATIVVNDAGQIAKKSPELSQRFQLFELRGDVKRVVFPDSSSFMTPIGRDSKTQDGFDPSLGIIDEYHAHPTSHIRDVIESGTGARRQPLINIITTAGFNKQSPCYELRKTSIDILNGVLTDDSFFACIHSLDETDNWHDDTTWVKANPNINASVKLSNLRDLYQKAVNEKGQKEVDFKTKNLNIWTDASAVWIPDSAWKKNTHKLTPEILRAKTCYGGLDLASVSDLNCYVLLFPDVVEIKGKPITALVPFFYMPEDNVAEASKRSRVDFKKWIDAGYIKTTPGNITDYNFIEADVVELTKIYDFKSLAFDPWNAGNLIGDLSNHGIECHELRQTYSGLSNPTKQFERMFLGGLFEHFNNPVLRWMLGNVELDKDANGNIKPNKAKSQNKIDGISATINALAESMTNKQENQSFEFISL